MGAVINSEGELFILRVKPEASDTTIIIADEPEVGVIFMQSSLLVLLL